MEENFRNTLIILSAVIIGAIFVHGLWTIRKSKNPYKLKTSKRKIESIEPNKRGYDSGGFDQDGVGKAKAKIMPSADETKESLLNAMSNMTDEVMPAVNPALDLENNEQPLSENEPTLNQIVQAQEQSVYQTPITQAKLQTKPKVAIKLPKKLSASKAALKRNQMEINFGDINTTEINLGDGIDLTDESTPTMSSPSQTTNVKPVLEQQVIALSVVMPENQFMAGASLLPSLLTMGMKYGEMNIFHRHQDNAGNGDITFSLANMMKPGTFALDSMETFATQGVSLFMTLPNAGNPFDVYEQMLAAAKNLAQEFNGKVHDDKRNVLTKQSEQHYLSVIREFDRKSRIAAVE